MVRKIRYTATGTGTSIVYRNCLLSLIAADSSTVNSTNAVFLISSIRIQRCKVYMPNSGGTEGFQSTSMVWHSQFGKDTEIQAVGNGVQPACIDSRPPKLSGASFWSLMNQNESEKILSIHVGDSSMIVDIWIEFTLADGICSYGVFGANQAAANILYLPLDSLNSASSAGGSALLAADSLAQAVLTGRTSVSPANAV
jgi:hypothetical protein